MSDEPPDGILVSQSLRALIAAGGITAEHPVRPEQIQPSSLDLRLGGRLWQLQCSFLPGDAGIEAKLDRLATAAHRLDPDTPIVLHRGGVYLAELEEGLALPAGVRGRGNPKSSTGRLDVFVRLLTEHGKAFDTVPDGYQGRLWLEITPQSFHVALRRADTLGQLRLARGRPGDDAPDPVMLSVDLAGDDGGPVGYVARRHMPPIDLAQRGLPVDRYWTAMPPAERDGHVLEPEQFYIFATRERLRIPPELCAELVPFDATKGELRTHYAGFIDAGFGWDAARDSPGAKLVLEIRTHDVPFLLEHGQPLFRMEFMRNETLPDRLYGQSGSNYQMQGLKLAKQFDRSDSVRRRDS